MFDFDELVLMNAAANELARQAIKLPPFEADASAAPEAVINPVDLGTILPPADWLLLGPGQSGRLTVRAIARGAEVKAVKLKAWFESASEKVVTQDLPLAAGRPFQNAIDLPAGSAESDVLRAAIVDVAGAELWSKSIHVMRVATPPRLPRFGATEIKLRYDAPISIRDPSTGRFSSIPYAKGWDPALKDVVVSLPNGSRFVFWRGSSYIPFWATRHNAGLCCEWAEIIGPWPPDRVDCIEPLMDKELRYGRVEIVESTPARVHVRWTYQSNDLNYKVWGDQAVEDYYFYPDGFGTRVITLKRDPVRNYELSEFIAIGPQEAYPLSFVPAQPMTVLFDDGEVRRVNFPATDAALGPPRDATAVYRVRPHKDDPESVVYFNPRLRKLPHVFGPFFDQGQLVTPAYWGSHWPLARGNMTGSAIDERIHATPHHTSLATWAGDKPDPISTRTGPTIDTLGHAKVMTIEQWVWMLGMSDGPDAEMLTRARSFANPPSIEVTGARIHPEGYAPERRAVRLIADVAAATVTVKLSSAGKFSSPVFEIDGPRKNIDTVEADGAKLDPSKYAWDGKVLWLDLQFDKTVRLEVRFRP